MFNLNSPWCGLVTCVKCIVIKLAYKPEYISWHKVSQSDRTHPALLLLTTRSTTINYMETEIESLKKLYMLICPIVYKYNYKVVNSNNWTLSKIVHCKCNVIQQINKGLALTFSVGKHCITRGRTAKAKMPKSTPYSVIRCKGWRSASSCLPFFYENISRTINETSFDTFYMTFME